MAITGQKILDVLSRRAWAGVNKDDMIWGNEEAETIIEEINAAVRYLINLVDFPFKSSKQDFFTRNGNITYSMPDGQISTIYNLETLQELTFIDNASNLNKNLKGTPTHYYIEYLNPEQPTLKLYPIPDKRIQYRIEYNVLKPVKSADGLEEKFEFENADDVINMPPTIDYLFMDCVIMRAMATNNKDEQDENYRPMLNEFDEVWNVFKKTAKPTSQNIRIVI